VDQGKVRTPAKKRTNVYVDGFNLYYGCLKGTPYRWLDIHALCTKLLPKSSINRIRYFTALVQPRPGDPDQAQRQQTYLRTLRAVTPNLTVHEGKFLSSQVRASVVTPPPQTILVHKTEEKGSDVNLAAYLLVDAFDKEYEAAAVISNDTDLITPITMVRDKFKRPVVVINPHPNTSWPMRNAASAYKPIRAGVLAASQLPDRLKDAHGTITKPPGW
jgi:uncharacterized LabA/DUF88 family protein